MISIDLVMMTFCKMESNVATDCVCIIFRGFTKQGAIRGIVFSEGQLWQEQRRFVQQHLNIKREMSAEVIQQEAQLFCDKVSKETLWCSQAKYVFLRKNLNHLQMAQSISKTKEPLVINGLFLELVNRVLWRTVSGKTIDDNKKMEEFKISIRDLFRVAERGELIFLLQARNGTHIINC
jgi:hypothetical protein